jgi:hypothetical protein
MSMAIMICDSAFAVLLRNRNSDSNRCLSSSCICNKARRREHNGELWDIHSNCEGLSVLHFLRALLGGACATFKIIFIEQRHFSHPPFAM